MKKLIPILFITLIPAFSFAQDIKWIRQDSLYKYMQPFAAVQMWSTYTMGEKARLLADGPLEPVANRLNFTARRARLGFRGKPYKNFSYYLALFYDNLGRDRYTGTRAGVNEGQIGVWDAYMSWNISPKKETATVTFGYFRPQISRECITAAFAVNSFEKSLSQTYVRQHITGKNHGRTMGVNVGGLKQKGKFSINYNAGIFNNNATGNQVETAGRYWSPLLTARIAFSLGDAEMEKYGISYDVNYFNKRKGITVGINAAEQGKTELFSANTTRGVDILFNYLNLNVDGEWLELNRKKEGKLHGAQTGHMRVGYNIIIDKKIFLEPAFMVTAFKGEEGSQFTGEDRIYDAGINWYLNKKNCKLSLHYVWQEGEGKNGFTDGVTFEKGDYAGLGLVIML